ncbi:MAG: peptide chain release factor N(5)-glutamine methyltransferase [Desulfobacterales bacterium]|jgi:release factor glutamine methyltransferase
MHNPAQPDRPEWTIMKLIRWAANYFDSHDIDSSRATAEILLAHALNARRIDLYLHYDQPLNSDERDRFKALIKRRLNREPVAYIVGCKEFWSMELEVTTDVLIPRPETECLVERALERLGRESNSKSKSILELGTGSGAVILALASENSRHFYWGTDISVNAVLVARRNAIRHGIETRVYFIVADWLTAFRGQSGLFDLIISNPPYVRSGDLVKLQPEIQAHEPLSALDGAEDGLRCLRKIVQSAHLYLKPAGVLLLEMGADQKAQLKQMINKCGQYENIEFYKDYSGYDRIAAMTKRKNCCAAG